MSAAAETQDLTKLRLVELHALALEQGLEQDAIDATMDGEAPKASLVALLASSAPRLASQQTATTATTATIDVTALLAGDRGERRAACAALETTRDVSLAVACVPLLCGVLRNSAAETDAAEYSAVSGVLARLVALDPVRVGGEYCKDFHWLSPTAKGNAVDAIVSKPAAEITKQDARTLAAIGSVWVAATANGGYDSAFAAAGISAMDWIGAMGSDDSMWGSWRNAKQHTDEPKMKRVVTLILQLLREDRAEMSCEEVAGAWHVFEMFGFFPGHPDVCLHAVESGAIGLAIAELRTGSPAESISASLNPSGVRGSAMMAIACVVIYVRDEHKHLLVATPGLLDVLLDGLKAYEQAEDEEDVAITPVFSGIVALYNALPAFFASSDLNRTAMRGAASSIRFALDNPLSMIKELGMTTNMIATFLASAIFGRDEEEDAHAPGGMRIEQRDVDECVFCILTLLDGRHPLPIQSFWSETLLDMSVSDRNKMLLLEVGADFFTAVRLGLFIDADHPKADSTPVEIQAVFQRNFTEALQQIALFAPGRTALLQEASLMSALEETVQHGMTPQAREHAEGALMALSRRREMQAQPSDSDAPKHIMLSYQVKSFTGSLVVVARRARLFSSNFVQRALPSHLERCHPMSHDVSVTTAIWNGDGSNCLPVVCAAVGPPVDDCTHPQLAVPTFLHRMDRHRCAQHNTSEPARLQYQ
jgi:hypothetical protein